MTTRPTAVALGALLLGVAVSAVEPARASTASPTPVEMPRELVLAGGALGFCSDLAPDRCRARPEGAARQPARYRVDEAGLQRALAPALWSAPGAPARVDVEAMLRIARLALGDAELPAEILEKAFDLVCLQPRCEAIDPRRPWSAMLDVERAAVLAALERPQRDANGQRPVERAMPEQSREPGGVAVLEAFVAAARARTSGRPKIAVVTGSAFDPMEPVDAYLEAFRALGADAVWWPVDAAVAAARFEQGDCAALPRLRLERLRLPGREAVYPDLEAYQRGFCASQPALMLQVQGVFFTGGDQWRLRQAFVHADDRPNDWLRELQQAHAEGRLVVGGTSAGAAVQSAAWMLGNGEVEAAVARPARRGAPPETGCARARRCGDVAEDALTLWPAGGLRLAEGAIVDTHFSERARELRLLMAMQAADARWGYGADEASALRVRQFRDRREIEAIGVSGGWVFRRHPGQQDEVEAWYLVPGAVLVVGPPAADGREPLSLTVSPQVLPPRRASGRRAGSAFEAGALRQQAQALARRCRALPALPAPPGRATLACAEGVRAWRAPGGLQGVGPLRLRFERD
jgi:cyanophycinase